MTRSRDVADTQDNVGGAVAPFVAGKNKIINGDFGIWQRGTSFTIAANGYTADRWYWDLTTAIPTGTISRQSFTAGSAPDSGYESTYFFRTNITAHNNCPVFSQEQKIEDVRTFAGQTVTVSFWAKADASTTLDVSLNQKFGTGGSATVTLTATVNLTTSWQRLTFTTTLGSMSGKTIGTNSCLSLAFLLPLSGSFIRVGTYDIWGVQLEAGSVATPFTPAGGGFPGAELALCQRYYYRVENDATSSYVAMGTAATTTLAIVGVPLKNTMRVTPTAVDYSSIRLYDTANASIAITSATLQNGSPNTVTVGLGVASGLTQHRPYYLFGNTLPSYIGFSAEL